MRKVIATALTVGVLSAVILTACGRRDKDKNDTSFRPASSPTEVAESAVTAAGSSAGEVTSGTTSTTMARVSIPTNYGGLVEDDDESDVTATSGSTTAAIAPGTDAPGETDTTTESTTAPTYPGYFPGTW